MSQAPTNPSDISCFSADTFADLLSGDLLDISVGPDSKRWSLHRNLLAHHSAFFSQESDTLKDGKLDLPNEDTSAFRLLVKWLYQGHIQDVSTIRGAEKKWDYAYACQNLYLLCETIGIHVLKNIAIDQFRKGCAESRLVPGAEEIKPIYERTAAGSPFRKLVSKIAARQIMDPDLKRDASVYRDCFQANPDFAVDVLNAIRDGTEGMLLDDPTKGNGCQYHVHENGDNCHKTVHFEDDDDATIVVG
ncbi:hypothetical protein H2198_008468 [Neophaeococcomyces mojaviensis]|uniref:Uncharacterized protein n=1 Tax=Neophaeococcomyces mojaviensis TaxID=3383035 RepID=A0ACC2ZXV2_9EURO|nr:hypothetical protein H2198_008468 [Knufia sp. JES_112]